MAISTSFFPVLSPITISSSSLSSSSWSSTISSLSPFKPHYHGWVAGNPTSNGRLVIQCSSSGMAPTPDPVNVRYGLQLILLVSLCISN
jgi:hypothetical protein